MTDAVDKPGAAGLLVAARAAPIYQPHQKPCDREDDRRPHEPASRILPGSADTAAGSAAATARFKGKPLSRTNTPRWPRLVNPSV